MRCSNCQSETPASSKFCASCGKPTSQESDIKSPDQVTAQWLQSLLDSEGYSTEIAEKDTNLIVAKHNQSPNLLVTLRSNISLITIQSLWSIKPVSWSQKKEFLQAVNMANNINWLCTCHSPEPHNSLEFSTFIFLSEKISNRDVLTSIEMFSKGVLAIIEKVGLNKYA